MKQAVVIGGYSEDSELLYPVSEALYEGGYADYVATFPYETAMQNPDTVRRASKDALVITHSAGIMAVVAASQPERLVVYNGPEPRSIGALAISTAKKTVNHIKAGNPKIIRNHGREFLRNLPSAHRRIPEISRHSTLEQLRDRNKHLGSGAIKIVTTEEDELFKPTYNYLFDAQAMGFSPVVEQGGHDELLTRPRDLLRYVEF